MLSQPGFKVNPQYGENYRAESTYLSSGNGNDMEKTGTEVFYRDEIDGRYFSGQVRSSEAQLSPTQPLPPYGPTNHTNLSLSFHPYNFAASYCFDSHQQSLNSCTRTNDVL